MAKELTTNAKDSTSEIKAKKLTFDDHVEDKAHTPNATIKQLINENRFPLSNNKFFGYDAPMLGADEFNRCVAIYKDRTDGMNPMDVMRVLHEMQRIEQGHSAELEDLAINLVREMYNVPSSVDLRAMLNTEQDTSSVEEQIEDLQNEDEEISPERKAELAPEIEKRKILNSLVHGAAIHQWTSAYYIVHDELDRINPELVNKYNQYSSLVNYWNWQMYLAPMFEGGQIPMLQGMNKVNIKDKKITASAINFPVLIHELSKGVIDMLISKGIPQLPPNELKYIYKNADKYSEEQFHYFFGPTLWRSLLDLTNAESQKLPIVISELAQMDYDTLAKTCIDITFNKNVAKDKYKYLIKKTEK